MNLFSAILGAALLLLGRRLYWVAIGVLGFLMGAQLAEQWLAADQVMLRVLVAVCAGVLGAFVAVAFQRVAFALAGFFAAGYLALGVAESFELESNLALISFAVAGILGAIVASLLMDWAIITLTSLAGASAIALALNLSPAATFITFLVLAIIGIIFQSRAMESDTEHAEEKTS